MQKSLRNICTVIFLSISLHPQSGNNTGCNGSEKVFDTWKFRVLKNFSKKFQKDLVVSKICFIFATAFHSKTEMDFWKRFFDLLVTKLRESVVFICQFPFGKRGSQDSNDTFNIFYNGEFDPGSGWTLAAGLTHASRGAAGIVLAQFAGDRRTGA